MLCCLVPGCDVGVTASLTFVNAATVECSIEVVEIESTEVVPTAWIVGLYLNFHSACPSGYLAKYMTVLLLTFLLQKILADKQYGGGIGSQWSKKVYFVEFAVIFVIFIVVKMPGAAAFWAYPILKMLISAMVTVVWLSGWRVISEWYFIGTLLCWWRLFQLVS